MWSGGDPTTSATGAPDPSGAFAELLRGQGGDSSPEADAVGAQIDDDEAALRTVNMALEAANNDEGYARRAAANSTEQAQGRKQTFEGAERDKDAYERQIEDMRSQLTVLDQRVSAMWDLGRFYKDEYARNLTNAMQKAALEVYCEARNAEDDIFISWHASCVRFGAAIAGLESRLSTALAKHEYLKLDPLPTDASPSKFAEAQAQQADLDAQKKKADDMKVDTYQKEKIKEAKKGLAEAEAERDAIKADETKKAQEAKRLKAEYEQIMAELKVLKARHDAIRAEMAESRRGSRR